MNWLTDITNWFREQFMAIWSAIETFFKDLLVFLVETMLDLARVIVENVPVPDFLQNISICDTLAMAGPTALWVSDMFHLPTGMTAIAAGVAFRLLRKLMTLGQW